MLELLFLLLPLAAAYGWYMGHRSAVQEKQEHSDHLSREYVTGLNLILSNQSDKALDHFIELLQLDSEAIDTHLALGNLFQSRGEVDRAIKLHQNIIARSDINIDQKNLALQELANDYLIAGFLDRAENILVDLVDEPEHRKKALKQLLVIYQQTREWDKAIAVATALVKMGKTSLRVDISHFYCELAQISILDHDEYNARLLLKKAFSIDKKHAVRASLMLAQLDFNDEKYKLAIKSLEYILEQDIDFIGESLPLLVKCYDNINDHQGLIKFLNKCQSIVKNTRIIVLLAQYLAKDEGIEIAENYLKAQVLDHPSLKGIYELIRLHILEAEEGKAKESLKILLLLTEEQLKTKPHYRCQKCGFESKTLYWQCPSCKRWGTVKPIRGLDGE